MTSRLANPLLHTSLQFTTADLTSQHALSAYSDVDSEVQNASVPEGCFVMRPSKTVPLPWNGTDTIVTKEAELITRQMRTVILLVLFLIGGPANVINMVVFFKHSLRDRVNLVLFSLSLSDEMSLAVSMVTYGEEFFSRSAWEQKPGPVRRFMMNSNLMGLVSTSLVSLVLSAIITCERCHCVFSPLKYRTLMRTRTMAVIIITVYGVFLAAGFLTMTRYNFVCVYFPDTGVVSNMARYTQFYVQNKDIVDYSDMIFFGPGFSFGVWSVVVTATVMTIIKLRQTVAWRSETSSSLSPREVALTKMLIGTSVLLIVCMFPHTFFHGVQLFVPDINYGRRYQHLYLMFYAIKEAVLFINSSFNIFIYYKMGSRYRDTFWALFKRKTKSKSNDQ